MAVTGKRLDICFGRVWHLFGICIVAICLPFGSVYWRWFGIFLHCFFGIYISIGSAFILAFILAALAFILAFILALLWQQVLGTFADSNLEYELTQSNLRVAPDIGARVGNVGTLVEYVDGGAWVEPDTAQEKEVRKMHVSSCMTLCPHDKCMCPHAY